MPSSRVYRHRPWLVGLGFVALGVAAATVKIVTLAVAAPTWETVLKTLLVVALLLPFEAFPVLNWRVRTVVDDSGVTQHWITRSFHLPYDEITGLEIDQVWSRWFVRVICGERTFEIIPCHNFLPHYLSTAIGRPRALKACLGDIEARLRERPAG